MFRGAPPALRSWSSRTCSVKAKTRRSTPVVIRSSTSAFTFSTPASANTTGVVAGDGNEHPVSAKHPNGVAAILAA